MSETTSTTNDPKRLDGKAIADVIYDELALEVQQLKKQNIIPGLAVVLVGDRKDSRSYVTMKKKAAEKIGVHFVLVELPEKISQADLLTEVGKLNRDPSIHGLIVQLPLPAHIHETTVLDAVGLSKDVDGFHPSNMGALAMKGRTPLFVPCTPLGCMELLKRKSIDLSGKHVVVVGRSNIVGVPVSLLALNQNATVTVCHSRTVDLPSVVRTADVIIAAAGRPEMVKKDWVKPGAVVIDVGINAVEDKSKKTGFRLVGDVAYEEVREVASLITPVPGGVGPMTVAMLIKQSIEGAKRVAAAGQSHSVLNHMTPDEVQQHLDQLESRLKALESKQKQ